MLPIQKRNSRRSRLGSAKLDYDENLSAEDYEGILWMRKYSNLRNTYVPTWCSLKDRVLDVYDKKNGNILETINIVFCTITPFIKYRSPNFYFRIINDWFDYSFETSVEKEYGVWINRLQYIASYNDNIENTVSPDCVLKQFSRDECTSLSDKSDSIDKFNLKSSHASDFNDTYDLYDTVNDNKESNHVPNPEINKSSCLESTDDVFIDENESTGVYADNTNVSINTKFKLMRDLERQIRDKSLWLAKIDDILTKSHIPHEIDLFFDEYHMQLTQ